MANSYLDWLKGVKTPAADKGKAGAYDPQTGIGYDENGTRYEKYTWEPDSSDPTKLYRENAGTGNRIGTDYISNPATGSIVQQADPYVNMMNEYRAQINALSIETDPDYNENLEQVSSEEMDKEIL